MLFYDAVIHICYLHGQEWGLGLLAHLLVRLLRQFLFGVFIPNRTFLVRKYKTFAKLTCRENFM